MSKKLIQAAKDLYQSRKNTPLKNDKNNFSRKISETQFTRLSPFIPFTFPEVDNLLSIIQKQVIDPIHLHTQVFYTDRLQKCLTHNHTMTLYCINQHKPLCAMCMYQSNIHKVHKVIPINQAHKLLQIDRKDFQKIIQNNLKTQNLIIQKSDLNLIKAEKDYPSLLERLHKFYTKLQQIIIDKKNQHFNFLHNTWSKIKQLNSIMKAQIKKINEYTRQKLRQINERKGEQNAILNFNISFHLTKLQNCIHYHLFQEQKDKYFIHEKQYSQIQQMVKEAITFKQIKPANIETDISNLKISRKKSAKTLNRQKSGKSLIITPKNIQKQYQQSFQNKPIVPKNRHGKSEMLSTIALKQQRIILQDKIIKQKQEQQSHSKSNVSLAANKKLRNKSSLKPNSKTPTKK